MSIAAAPRPWDPKSAAKPVAEILAALEIAVDEATRRELEKVYHRRQYFHGDGRGHVTLLIRTITESEGNAHALIAPVVAAVSSAMRPRWTSRGLEWLEAFDSIRLLSILETMRSLEIFRESSLGTYLGMSISNRLWKVFGPGELPAPPPAKKRRPRWKRPPGMTEEAWDAVLAPRKARRRQLERARYAAKRAGGGVTIVYESGRTSRGKFAPDDYPRRVGRYIFLRNG